MKIEYDPEFGVLILPKGKFELDPSKDRSLTAFGRFAAHLRHIEDEYGFSPQTTFSQSLELFEKVVLAFEDGATLAVQDKDGKIIQEWKTLDKYLRYIHRKEELDGE